MKAFYSKSGLTLVEVMVAIVVVGIGVVALSSLVTSTSRLVQVGLDESSLLKTLDSLESQIIADSIYTPPVEALPNPLDLNTGFASDEIAERRCFSSTMGEVALVEKEVGTGVYICPPDEARYELIYFKIVETDTEIATSTPAQIEMAKLPLYRYHFRVKYGKDMAELIDFSRLVVGVMPY